MASIRPWKPVQGELLGPYELVREIGRGGMAIVFEAKHIDLARRVAVKVMHARSADDDVAAQRFLREGRAVCHIRHPHVVEVFDIGVEGGIPYLVMELLEGSDLRAMLAAEGPLSIPRALEIMLPIVSAVAAAHDAGIVHRDLKPANVFITKDRGRARPKVLDFGISKMEYDDAESLTRTEGLLGTVHYMAPEQTRGAKNADRRSDQYTLGVILYEATTGRRPFVGEGSYEIMHAIMTASLVPPSALVPEIPRDFDAVLLRALDRDPKKRFPSVRAFGESLAAFADETLRRRWAAPEESEEIPPSADQSPTTFSGRRKRPSRSALLSALALTLLGLTYAAQRFSAQGGQSSTPAASTSELTEPAPRSDVPEAPLSPAPVPSAPVPSATVAGSASSPPPAEVVKVQASARPRNFVRAPPARSAPQTPPPAPSTPTPNPLGTGIF